MALGARVLEMALQAGGDRYRYPEGTSAHLATTGTTTCALAYR